MNPITNSPKVAKFITAMTKNDAMAPIVALESVVVTGRTYQAYKRGGSEEARERGFEEVSGSIVWLGGVKSFNALGDKTIEWILKKPNARFDVGTDKILRTPFDNFISKAAPKGFSPRSIALMKGAKVVTSVALANLLIGVIVPKINHTVTTIMRSNKDVTAQTDNNNTSSSGKNINFKGGGIGALNAFTNAIENTNTGKLLSTDIGTVSGRTYNARTKEERREILFRDISSIYFYMWAQGHVGNALNLIESGRSTRLNPEAAATLNKHLEEFLDSHGSEMSIEEFKKYVLGDISKVKLPEKITFEEAELSAFEKFMKKEPLQVAKVSEIEKLVTDPILLERIKEMSKLQPKRGEDALITRQQLLDAYNNAKVTDPELLDKVYNDFTGGAHKNEFKFVSNSKLENLKKEMIDYAQDICKEAKDGKINKDVLKKAKDKNIMYNGINFAAGFVFAAAFLSTFIPKIQYYITRKTTGVDAFPGTYNYNQNKDMVA